MGQLMLIALATFASEDLTCVATGGLIAAGKIGFLPGTLACIAGIYIGDLLLYFGGRFAGRPIVRWRPLRSILTDEKLDRASAWADHHPNVVFCSVTPYGIQAPPELHNAKSFNVFHASGWGLHTPSHADPAKPPLKGPGRFLADYEAGLDAALCVASSLFWQLHTGAGQFIDVSAHAVLASRSSSSSM